MDDVNKGLHTWAIILGVFGGVLILLAGVGMLFMAPMMGMMMGAGGMTGMAALFALWSLSTGGTVLYGAYRLHREPHETRQWSVAIVAAGVASLLATGGFFVGAAASITGGVLGLVATRSSHGKAQREARNP